MSDDDMTRFLFQFDDMMMIIDPDEEDSSKEYGVRLEGETDGLISLESFQTFPLNKELCAAETSDLPTPLSAACTVFTPRKALLG